MGKESTGGTGKRFRQIADALFEGNKSELARSLGMQPSSFAKYTDGSRRPGSKVLERLSRLGININWFLSGEGEMMVESAVENPSDSVTAFVVDHASSRDPSEGESGKQSGERFYCIPVVRLRLDESGDRQLKETEGVTCLSESFIQQRYGADPLRLREFRFTGNAMGDTIRPGDRVLVEIGEEGSLVDGEVYLLRTPTGVLIRRTNLQGNGIVLVADNPSVPAQEVSKEEWEEKYQSLGCILEVTQLL